MLTAEKKKMYTVADYMQLEEGAPFQLINYELTMSPAPSLLHQLILSELNDIFKDFVKKNHPGGMVIFSPLDIYLDDGNVYQPDLVYVSKETKKKIVTDKINGAPDLVVEVLSPASSRYDLHQKKDVYEKHGVKEYIVVDPILQIATIYVLKDNGFVLHQKAENKDLFDSVVLPGLPLCLNIIFNSII